MLPGIEILQSIYLDGPKARTLLQDVHTIIPQIKRPIHRYTIEYFLQKGLVYWMFARPQEFAYETHNDTPLNQIASSLFDIIYASNNDERRRHSTWNLLGLLISFVPSAFADMDISPSAKPKGRSLKLMSNKKVSYFNAINSMISLSHSQVNDIIISATNHILKAGAILHVLNPSSPIVSYAKSLYPVLIPHLFASPSRSSHVVNLPIFQATFVSCFSVLNPDRILSDIFPMIKSKDEFMFYAPNILQGHINLRQILIFTDQYTYMMERIFDLLRVVMTDTTVQLRYFESQPNFTSELSRSKIYGNYVSTINKCYVIFSFNPTYFIKNYNYQDKLENDVVFRTLIDSTLSTNASIEQQSLEFTLNFLNPALFEKFGFVDMSQSTKPAFFTYVQCGAIIERHAERIIDYPEIDESSVKHLKLIKALFESRCALIRMCKFDEICDRDPTQIEPREVRQRLSRIVETTMYICLCSSKTAVCKLALEILNGLVQEAICIENLDDPASSSWSVVPNFAMHSEFSSSAYVLTGSVAVQKRLYQFLQNIEMATPAIFSAWNIMIVRWRELLNEIITDSSGNRELIKQWRGYSGFLCSVLSPHLTEDEKAITEGQLSDTSKTFLIEMVDLLTVVKSPYLRETARDVLSRDTNHLSYHFIFKTLEVDIATRLKGGKPLVEEDFLLLEQSVMLLRSVINMIHEDDLYLSVDIGGLALTIVKCLDSLYPDERVMRLRILYSHLFELIAAHKDALNMKHDLSIRNEIADIFSSWLDKCLSDSSNFDTESTLMTGNASSRNLRRSADTRERQQRECICAIIQAFTVILLDLRLDPTESVHEMDLIETRTQKFGSIFTLFLRILEKCRLEETGSGTGNLVLGERLATVKAQTIGCASKLLNANLDVGLKFALPLGFKEDAFIRTSFIKILDNILAHGSKEAAEATEFQRYQELAEFMTQHISITLSLCDLCPATEVDEFARALLNIFDAKGKCLNLVKAVVTREVEKADAPLEILRRNCVATKVLSLYAHQKGAEYLKQTLGPFMKDLIANPEPYVFESNPEKIPEGETEEANFIRFERTLEKLLESFRSTNGDIPDELREICHTISTTAGPKFAGSKDNSVTAISAFFFLRFICPSLVTPEAVGLLDSSPPKNVRRTFLILAKIIQNMAFGSSSFVKLSIFKLHPASYAPNSALIIQFLKGIAAPVDEATMQKCLAESPQKAIELVDIEVLHKFLYNHWEDINHKLILDQRLKNVQLSGPRNSLVDARRSTISTDTDDTELRASQKLTSLVRNLGRPRSLKHANQAATDSNANIQDVPRLQEFISRNAHRDMGPVIERRMISEGWSKEGLPLIILTARNFSKDEVDIELLICRFFQIASKIWKQKFGIVYDITGYTQENEVPASARSVAGLMMPEEMVKNCVGFYFINVASDFSNHLKGLVRHYYSGIFLNPARVKYQFLTTSDIPKVFNISTINLDARTIKVANDVRIIFNNVYRFSVTRNDMTRVTIKLGNEYVQVRSQEPFNYVKSAPGYFNDIFHLSEVGNVFASNTNGHPDEFTLHICRSEEKKIILHCSKSQEIIRAILNAKTRLHPDSKESVGTSPERSLAYLLNIALSGLCSENSDTQEASYNLMASIQHRFKLELGMDLHGGKGLRLPANVFNRVKMFSQSIANTRPDLTLEMCKYMFEAFEITWPDRRQGVLMYAIPWVENIAKYVLSENTEQACQATARIIRKFLDISIAGNRDFMFLLQSVWPLILAVPSAIPIVIDEIVFLLIDNGIQSGSKLDDIVSILTSNPSIDVCRVVLDRIKNMSLDTHEIGNSLVQHSKWREFVIHITFLSSILFENPDCAEVFYPDLSFCMVMFIYTGPYAFRKTVYNMVVNMIHSFLYSSSCDAEKQKHVYTIWKELTGSKGNMIFGISEEMKYVDYDYPVASLMFQIESCSAIVTDLASAIVSPKAASEYRAAYIERCLDIASQNYSVFQCRALIVMGCSAHIDVSDENVGRVLEIFTQALVSENDSATKDQLLTCLTFCLAKISDGLRVDSKYLPLLFWLAISLIGSSNSAVYNHALQLLHSTLKNLDEYGAFKNTTISSYLLSSRENFKKEWKQLEKLSNISFTHEYFEVQIVALLTRGLLKSATRASTLSVFEVFLSLTARNSNHGRETETFGNNSSSHSIAQQHNAATVTPPSAGRHADDEVTTISSASTHYPMTVGKFPSYMPFLFMLFIWSRTTAELKDYLWIAGYPELQIEDDIPSQIKSFLSSDSNLSLLCMYLGAQVFRFCENEDVLDSRVLSCLMHLGSINTDHFFKIYFVARIKIQSIVDSGPSLTILKSALDVAKCALCHLDDLSRKSWFVREMDSLLAKTGISALAHANNYGVVNPPSLEEDKELALFIKKLVSADGMSANTSLTQVVTVNESNMF